MEQFWLVSERRNGNLFIKITGNLTRQAATALLDEVRTRDDGQGNIFINTEKLSHIRADGPAWLAQHDVALLRQRGRLYLIGAQGFHFGLADCKVIVRRRRGCVGKCRGKCRKAVGAGAGRAGHHN